MATKDARENHDQHYKTLFRAFLRELLEITHPDLVPKLRFDKCRFLDKETYTDLLGGRGFRLDLVCEVPTVDGECRLLLVHIEIEERQPLTRTRLAFLQRMADYVMTLWLRHHTPIIPLVVSFSRHARRGLHTEEFLLAPLGERVLSVRYRQFGVAGVSAARFVRQDNPLGWALAVRMLRSQRSKVELQLACERRIVHAEMNEAKQMLLLNSVKTYAKLTPIEQKEYEQRLGERQNRAVKEASMTWLEKAEKRGEERGKKLGEERGRKLGEKRGEKRGALLLARRMVDTIWTRRFGALPQEVQAGLMAVTDVAVLEAICASIASAPDAPQALAQITPLWPDR